ncbi:LamG domain-containing protein [Puia dinghuensis]|uniref:LamG-like jellyroll fold domain-containing protein n=1 Tax=Puia dinghuensis TaxID=1792502 RepID=A0A8J2U6U9_9BACT|nr:LamG domain-containing protein [Puia dinghuensis]GGA82761.1 hypothetical protein GCM10011511_02230 [Puia dinghuensis]
MINRLIGSIGLLVLLFLFSVPFSRCTRSKTIITDTVALNNDTDVNLSKGLLVYYAFNNSLADSSGNGHNGTGGGNLRFTSDRNNNANGAVSFDGSSSYIMLKDSGSLSPGSLTVAVQFYTDTAVHESLFGKCDFSTANSIVWGATIFGEDPYPNSVSFGVQGPSVACGQYDPFSHSDLVYSIVQIQPKKWYQVTLVFDGGVEKIYLNGVLRNAITKSFTTAKQCTDASMILGAFWRSNPYFFHGKMDEFRFYNRALNEEEIAQLSLGFDAVN